MNLYFNKINIITVVIISLQQCMIVNVYMNMSRLKQIFKMLKLIHLLTKHILPPTG